jgi:hypothetical protein
MEKTKHFRAILGTMLVLSAAMLIWLRADLSAAQIGCIVLALLASAALWANNQRSEAFVDAARIPLCAAFVAFVWANTLNLGDVVFNILFSLLFAWLAARPYYLKWKKARKQAEIPGEAPVEMDRKGNL